MTRQKILVVDDEAEILKVIHEALTGQGFSVVTAKNGKEALEAVERKRPDLMILDLMLPEMDGFEVTHRIRRESDLPILVLTAKTSETDLVICFTLGADDYLTKPFNVTELVLRIKAILRRRSEAHTGKQIMTGPFQLNSVERTLFVNGKPVELTVKEFDLLWLLLSHPGKVFTREQIIEHIWQKELTWETNTVTVLVRRLREKVEPDPAKPRYLQTVWGLGYKYSG